MASSGIISIPTLYMILSPHINQIHASILELIYEHNDLLHVLASHTVNFREVKYEGWIHEKYKIKLQRYSEPFPRQNNNSLKYVIKMCC